MNILSKTPKKRVKTAKELQRIYEDEVEEYLVMRVKELGLDERKMNPLMAAGIPDRVVFAPKGDMMHQFVEVKRDSKAKKRPMQVYLARGLNTIFVTSKTEVEQFLMQYFTKYYRKPTIVVE